MIKELILSTCALSTFSSPVVSSVSRSSEPEQQQVGYVVEENGMRITYAYESNEVNSYDDLILGRAYHFKIENHSLDNFASITNEGYEYNFEFFNLDKVDFTNYEIDLDEATSSLINKSETIFYFKITDIFECYYYSPTSEFYSSNYLTQTLDTYTFTLEGDFILKSKSHIFNSFNCFSICENIPILSVERIYPDSIMGNVSEFVDEYLLSGIPLIDSVTNIINGTNVSLRSWLNTSICIVIVCLFITLLIVFVRWIFRLFAGLFRF